MSADAGTGAPGVPSRPLEQRREGGVRLVAAHAGRLEEPRRLGEERERRVAGQHRGRVVEGGPRRIDLEGMRPECGDEGDETIAKGAGRVDAEERSLEQGRACRSGERLQRVEHPDLGPSDAQGGDHARLEAGSEVDDAPAAEAGACRGDGRGDRRQGAVRDGEKRQVGGHHRRERRRNGAGVHRSRETAGDLAATARDRHDAVSGLVRRDGERGTGSAGADDRERRGCCSLHVSVLLDPSVWRKPARLHAGGGSGLEARTRPRAGEAVGGHAGRTTRVYPS